MFTTHTLGQVADASKVATDFLTLHAGSLQEQVAFNHQLLGIDKVSAAQKQTAEWYNTCSYYDVLSPDTTRLPILDVSTLLAQIKQAEAAGYEYKASIIGPVSLLQTLHFKNNEERLQYLEKLLPLYTQLLSELNLTRLSWLQLDEPMLTQPLTRELRHAYRSSYFKLQRSPIKLMVSTGAGNLDQNLQLACLLPAQALHIDALLPKQTMSVVDWLPRHKILSLGVVDGKTLAKSDLTGLLTRLKPIAARLKERLWLAPNQSFIHLPVDGDRPANHSEGNAFVIQKIRELNTLAQALKDGAFKQPISIPRTNSPEGRAHIPVHKLRLVHSR